MLRIPSPALGRPHADTVKNSKHSNLAEIRKQVGLAQEQPAKVLNSKQPTLMKKACVSYHLVIIYFDMEIGRPSEDDESLATLLNLDGEIFFMDKGYWTKFEAFRVAPEPHIPHGVRYCLTLHDRNNRRLLGFDNAHAFKPKTKRYGARKISWDHKHEFNVISPYEYESAGELLDDFWREVDRIMSQYQR